MKLSPSHRIHRLLLSQTRNLSVASKSEARKSNQLEDSGADLVLFLYAAGVGQTRSASHHCDSMVWVFRKFVWLKASSLLDRSIMIS